MHLPVAGTEEGVATHSGKVEEGEIAVEVTTVLLPAGYELAKTPAAFYYKPLLSKLLPGFKLR